MPLLLLDQRRRDDFRKERIQRPESVHHVEQRGCVEVVKDKPDPLVVRGFPQTTERLTECEIAEDVEGDVVEPEAQTERTLSWREIEL